MFLRSRQTVAACLAVYSMVVASGAPLPLTGLTAWAVPVADSAERFPCEACPCGCGTAAHCWSDCCCHTLAQRLAWARREGVRPPETALDAAERAGLDVGDWRGGVRYVVRLPVDEAPNGDIPADNESLPPCCRAKARKAASEATASACSTGACKTESSRPAPGVSLMQALACRGVTEVWLSLGMAPISSPPELVTLEATVYAAATPTPLWRRLAEAPPAPPPDRVV